MDDAVNTIVSILMVAVSFIPGGGAASAAAGAEAKVGAGIVKAGSKSSNKDLAARAVAADDTVNFGCKAIQQVADTVEDIRNGSLENLSFEDVIDYLLGDPDSEKPWSHNLDQISKAWDTLSSSW